MIRFPFLAVLAAAWAAAAILDGTTDDHAPARVYAGSASTGKVDGRAQALPESGFIFKERTPLNIAVSNDGERFRMFYALEDQTGEYSYPAIIQGKNGDLHITYTWNRKRIRYARIALSDVPA